MSAADTNDPSPAKKAMLSGIGVSRIQNAPVLGAGHVNSIPSAPPRSVTPISPWLRRAAVSASHRHTSHVEPSAAVMRAATSSKPTGVTAAVVAGAAVDGTEVAAGGGSVTAVGAGVVAGPRPAVVGVTEARTVLAVASPAPSSPPHAPSRSTPAAISHHDRLGDRHDIRATGGVAWHVVAKTCESCGATEQVLYAVHRQYITPADWDTPGREVTLEETELWCFSCCTHYPHVPVEE